MNIQIQSASAQDYPTVVSLLKELYLELGEEAGSITYVTVELVEKIVGSGKTKIFKAVDAEDVVGILTLTESQAIYTAGAFGAIDEMYVLPKYRSQNVGQQLIKEAVRIGREKGWMRLDVTAPSNENPRTVSFYKANGFVFTGPKLKHLY